jgi:intracellular multiplication protein IcmE
MAGQKENIKALFSNTRTRVIILFTFVLLLVMIVIGFIKFGSSASGPESTATLGQGPGGIRSIPGAQNQTVQYAALQQAQNIQQADKAKQAGNSAIPTIIESHAFGEGVDVVGLKDGDNGVGFATLARQDLNGSQRSLWIQSLQDGHCNKKSIDAAVAQGADLNDLRAACSCLQLKQAGYSIRELDPVCTCDDLKKAGFDIVQFKDAGFTATRLRLCGYVACDEKGVGFSAQDMKDAGFSDGELKGAGFSDADIARAGGLPDGMTITDVQKAGCSIESLTRLRAAGVSAAAIRRINGCSATQLKAAGFNALELKNAGFTAADLKKAGFTAAELKVAGILPRDLLDAGFSGDDLANAGFTAADIKAAEAILPLGLTAQDIKKAGCSLDAIKRQRLAGVSALLIHQYAGCSAQALKAAGFHDSDLLNAGFQPAQLRNLPMVSDAMIQAAGSDPNQLKTLKAKGVSAKRMRTLNGCSADALKKAGFSAADLKKAGFTAAELKAAGFTDNDLLNAGFQPADIQNLPVVPDDIIRTASCDKNQLKVLMAKGVSAKRIHDLNGCSADVLKQAGFDAKSLLDAGFTPDQLTAAGFSSDDIAAAMPVVTDQMVRSAGCDPNQLKGLFTQRVSAKRIHDLNGCTVDALKKAGFDAKALANSGLTPAQLLAAGFSPEELLAAGLSPSAVIAAGRTGDCSVGSLKAAHALGVPASAIKHTLGCSAEAMKAAGFSAADLKMAGWTAAELKNAGFGLNDLKNAGFSAKDLHAAGFSAQEMKDAGFTAAQLKEAGFSATDLKNAGFTAAQLKAVGFDAQALKDAGFNAALLRAAGFTAAQLKAAGFSATDMQKAGFSNEDLRAAGFSMLTGLAPAPEIPVQPSVVTTIPTIAGSSNQSAVDAANAKQLADIRAQQEKQIAAQRYQQKIQQRTSNMVSAANQVLQGWKIAPQQAYLAASEADANQASSENNSMQSGMRAAAADANGAQGNVVVKTGDILFAVIDTSVNTDEPGPILATVVSGSLKGAKLIGSFNLPANASKMVVSFNTLSIPGVDKTISINAYAIDPNTARTALSSQTDHHYLERYGALFASTFIEGFGNAFQSANTTITVGGTGGTSNTTVSNGVGNSLLENAVIGLATVGKAWGQVAAQNMSRPTTIELFAGTGVGVLFTQDLKIT